MKRIKGGTNLKSQTTWLFNLALVAEGKLGTKILK